MGGTQVVDTSHQIHRPFKRLELARQPAAPSHQDCQARAKGPIQPLDVAHVSLFGGSCLFNQGLYLLCCPPHDASDHPYHAPGVLAGALLDDLNNAQITPQAQARPSPFAGENRCPKDLSNRRNIRSKVINAQQHRPIHRTLTHLLNKLSNQSTVSAPANGTGYPQARRHSKCPPAKQHPPGVSPVSHQPALAPNPGAVAPSADAPVHSAPPHGAVNSLSCVHLSQTQPQSPDADTHKPTA